MVHFIPPRHRKTLLEAAQNDPAPVLISGGSGTGKGAIARWIHQNGARALRPFSTAIPNQPIAEQLQNAQGGTLLVPEIGHLPLSQQKILHHFIQTKSVPHPQNPALPLLLNVRVIATTSQSLEGRVKSAFFNPELYLQFKRYSIEMPPLTQRMDEFEDIARGILGEVARDLYKEHVRKFSPEALDKLRSYDWPGNLRELRNTLKLAVIKTQDDAIGEEHLPEFGHHRNELRATRVKFEKVYLFEILNSVDWNIEQAAELARISAEQLKEKIKEYGFKGPSRSTQ